MTCFSFLCSSFGSNDPLRALDAPVKQPMVVTATHPASSSSSSPSFSSSLSTMELGQPNLHSSAALPSRTLTHQSSTGFDSRRGSVETINFCDQASSDEAIMKLFSTPVTARRIFEAPPISSTEAEFATNLAKPRPSISAATSSCASSVSGCEDSHLVNIASVSTGRSMSPPNRVSPPLPPTHPNTRRLRVVHRELAGVEEPMRHQAHFAHESFSTPNTPESHTRGVAVPWRRASQPNSTSIPLRARRLQRHRALSSPGSPASMYIRMTHIDSSPALQAYFTSSSARSMMVDRLKKGLIAIHHDAMTQSLVYRQFRCDMSLAILSCSDLNSSSPSCQLMCPAITKVVRGISTRLLIEKSVDGGAALKDEHLLSICTHEGSIDIECVSQVERDEWFITFDFLVLYWNDQRRGASHESPMLNHQDSRIHDNGGMIDHLAQLHERSKLSSPDGKSNSPALSAFEYIPPSYSASSLSSQTHYACSNDLYSTISLFARDVDLVRELNRASLVSGCSALAQMQKQVDDLRLNNSQLIDALRESENI